jgi:prepilin-type N-terminal cleavage/methylation domain-containing protein
MAAPRAQGVAQRRRRGFTLVEMAVVSLAMSVVGGGILSFYLTERDGLARLDTEARWSAESSAAFAWLGPQVRSAESVRCAEDGAELVLVRGEGAPPLVVQRLERDGVPVLVAGSTGAAEARTVLRYVDEWRCELDGSLLSVELTLARTWRTADAEERYGTQFAVRAAQLQAQGGAP